jgi:ABC-2 type transport system permease protein/lipopolysaccharide transport system permease protein
LLVIFALGASLAVAAVLVYMRDLRQALPLLLQLGLFATPVAYGSSLIVHSHTKLVLYSAINPVAAAINGLRGTVLQGQSPDWTALGAAYATATCALAGGYWLFKKLEAGIADIA